MNNSTRNAIIVASVSLLLFTKCGGLGYIGHKLKHQGTQEKSIAQVTDVKFTGPMEYPSPTMKELEVVFPDKTEPVTEAKTEPVTEAFTEISTEAVTEPIDYSKVFTEKIISKQNIRTTISGEELSYLYCYAVVSDYALYSLDVQKLKDFLSLVPEDAWFMALRFSGKGLELNFQNYDPDNITLTFGEEYTKHKLLFPHQYATIKIEGDKFVYYVNDAYYAESYTLDHDIMKELQSMHVCTEEEKIVEAAIDWYFDNKIYVYE